MWAAKTVKRPRQQPAHPQYANYWAPLTRKRHILPHPAQPRHTNDWALQMRKRHQQEHRPQRPTERSDPTQHAKGRTGDCPGPRKGTSTRRNLTLGGIPKSCCFFVSRRPPPPPATANRHQPPTGGGGYAACLWGGWAPPNASAVPPQAQGDPSVLQQGLPPHFGDLLTQTSAAAAGQGPLPALGGPGAFAQPWGMGMGMGMGMPHDPRFAMPHAPEPVGGAPGDKRNRCASRCCGFGAVGGGCGGPGGQGGVRLATSAASHVSRRQGRPSPSPRPRGPVGGLVFLEQPPVFCDSPTAIG